MAERKQLSKKIRFEVFKRDKFTCQYCGRMAPDIVLEVDHIVPVADGGTNEIINLVTSCRDCNRGKSDRVLSDNAVIKKQQQQLLEIAEKREQLEMMLQWRDSLEDILLDEVDVVSDKFEAFTGYEVNGNGAKTIRRVIKEFGIIEALDALEIAVETYFDGSSNNSASKVIDKLYGICRNRRLQRGDDHYLYLNRMKKVCKHAFPYYSEPDLRRIVFAYIHSEEDFEILRRTAYACRSWGQLCERVKEVFEDGD